MLKRNEGRQGKVWENLHSGRPSVKEKCGKLNRGRDDFFLKSNFLNFLWENDGFVGDPHAEQSVEDRAEERAEPVPRHSAGDSIESLLQFVLGHCEESERHIASGAVAVSVSEPTSE